MASPNFKTVMASLKHVTKFLAVKSFLVEDGKPQTYEDITRMVGDPETDVADELTRIVWEAKEIMQEHFLLPPDSDDDMEDDDDLISIDDEQWEAMSKLNYMAKFMAIRCLLMQQGLPSHSHDIQRLIGPSNVVPANDWLNLMHFARDATEESDVEMDANTSDIATTVPSDTEEEEVESDCAGTQQAARVNNTLVLHDSS